MCWPVPAVVAALAPGRHRGRSRDDPADPGASGALPLLAFSPARLSLASLIVHEGNWSQGGDVFECGEINVASDSPLVMRPAIIEIRSPAAPTGVEKFA